MAVACPACGSPDHAIFIAEPVDREYFSRRTVAASIRRCQSCASLFQDPWPSPEEIRRFYGADYQNYRSTTVPLLSALDALYQRSIGRRFVSRYGKDAAVLDFGCGQGGFLRVLSEAGCSSLTGFDFMLYDELVDLPDVRFYDNLAEIEAHGCRFDVIRMRHVIEHLTDLDGTMTTLSGLLRPRGQIIGETPNAGHYTAHLMGQYWGPLHYPYHTILFSPHGLRQAARRWNLQLDGITGSLLPTGWAMSAENLIKRITGSTTRGRTAAYTLLMAASIPMVLLDRLCSARATANFDFILVR